MVLRAIVRRALTPIRSLRAYIDLPSAAKVERRRDRRPLTTNDPGPQRVVEEGIRWLGNAQDCSATDDGGVARHFSLISGWGSSYPETTGYIVPTMLSYAKGVDDDGVRNRAKVMVDWLTSIQLPSGGFQGGCVDEKPVVPVTFNTGQILLGLSSAVLEFGEGFREPMHRAAGWLVRTQDPDGCWRKYPTPFAEPGEKAYETHVAWGLFEAARLAPGCGYDDAAMSNVRWALKKQLQNGWFSDCCLGDPSRPLTHTLGYVLRGLVEAHRFTDDKSILIAAQRTADGLLTTQRPDGSMPGRLKADWTEGVRSTCLTGLAQIAHCWLMLYERTGKTAYRDAAFEANRFVRRTMNVNGPLELRGGVKGSFPIDGAYGRYEYLNWACKFVVDANLLELQVRGEGS
jgi:hypothetical protein